MTEAREALHRFHGRDGVPATSSRGAPTAAGRAPDAHPPPPRLCSGRVPGSTRALPPGWSRALAAIAAAALVTGCLSVPDGVRDEARLDQGPGNRYAAGATPGSAANPHRWPPRRVRWLGAPAPPDAAWPPAVEPRHGQILASEQGSAQGLLLSLFAGEPHAFVHTALVAMESGEAVVYESNGTLRAEIGGSLESRISGGVRRVPWRSFVADQRFVTVFDPPPGLDVEAALAYARARVGTGFDIRFDSSDASALYCTEFTANALAAGGLPRAPVPFSRHPSLQPVLAWAGIDSATLYSPDSIVRGLPPVALISRWHSPGQARAYFAAKAELQRRFTPDQRLGNVIRFSSLSGVSLRPPVQGFLAAVNAAAAGWSDALTVPDAELARRVAALAVPWLGPFDRG